MIRPRINQLIKLNPNLPTLCWDLELIGCIIRVQPSPLQGQKLVELF